MLNSCVLSGNIGADPEVFYSSEGEPIATFNLAFKSSKKKTGWMKITCFHLADIAEKFLRKGDRIAVQGILSQNKWQTEEGQTRTSYELIAQTIEFIKVSGNVTDEEQVQEDTPF